METLKWNDVIEWNTQRLPHPKHLFKVETVLGPAFSWVPTAFRAIYTEDACVKAHSFQRRKGPSKLNCFRLGRRERGGWETTEPGLTFLWRRKNVGKSVNVYPPGPTHMNRKTEQLAIYLSTKGASHPAPPFYF